MAASSPIVSSVAIALIIGLDATLAIVAVLLCTALVPLTLPPMAAALVGVTLEIGIGTFMLRLALLVGAAFAAAWLIRRVVPPARLAAQRELLDGLTVINLVLFGLAIMDGVTAYAFERPAYVLLALVAAYAFNLALQAAGYLAFRKLGRARRWRRRWSPATATWGWCWWRSKARRASRSRCSSRSRRFRCTRCRRCWPRSTGARCRLVEAVSEVAVKSSFCRKPDVAAVHDRCWLGGARRR